MTGKSPSEQSEPFLRTGSSLEPRGALDLTWLPVPPQAPEPLFHATAGRKKLPFRSAPRTWAASTRQAASVCEEPWFSAIARALGKDQDVERTGIQLTITTGDGLHQNQRKDTVCCHGGQESVVPERKSGATH